MQRLLAEEERKAKGAVRDFVQGAANGDVDLLWGSLEGLTAGEYDGGGWRRALRAVTRRGRVPRATREAFLQIFLTYGERLRQDAGDDLVLLDALRVLLPRYKGPSVTLYRGESAMNRRHRRYGSSWSSLCDVALGYAEAGDYRRSKGGSVLLVTRAPRLAILCAPALVDNRYGEQEYVVDRRCLRSVDVEERFSQLNRSEHDVVRLQYVYRDGRPGAPSKFL